MTDTKDDVRRQMRSLAKGRSDLNAASRLASQRVRALPEWSAAAVAMLFVAMGTEVDLAALFADDRRLFVPRVRPDGVTMEAVAVEAPPPSDNSGSTGWRRSAFGFWEADGPAADPAALDLVLVPGVAFTRDGRRLGRGKGHFDRFLPKLRPDCFKCGVCHDFQLLDDLPTEPHDVPLDAVLTPSGVYRRTVSPPRR